MYIWNPWSILDELHGSLRAGSSGWPQFDIADSDNETTLTADLPGMREEDVEISVQSPYLTIRGERKLSDDVPYVTRGRFSGAFERSFQLGDAYDLDQVSAHLADGVLTIRIAKVAKAKPRRIKLTTGVIDKVKGLLHGGKDQRAA